MNKGNGSSPPAGLSLAKTVLVTGGAGFIGLALVERILKEDLTTCVVVIDNGCTGDLQALVKFTESSLVSASSESQLRTLTINADIRDPKAWAAMMQGLQMAKFPPIREIYHLACPANAFMFTKFPVETLMTSVVGTGQMLIFAESLAPKLWPELPPPRIVHASSASVYGHDIYAEDHPAIPESYKGSVAFRGPNACYDEGKRAAETLVEDFAAHSAHGLDVRTARLFNVYGPSTRLTGGRVVEIFIEAALTDSNLVLHGNGSQTRSFTYIDDVVDGLMQLMAVPNAVNEVINLSSSVATTIFGLATTVLKLISDSKSTIEMHPGTSDKPMASVPDMEHARMVLPAWHADTSLDDGLAQTITWARTELAKRKEVKTMADLGVNVEKPVIVEDVGKLN